MFQIASVPSVGQPAPDFALPDTEKNTVRLSEQEGKPVVLLFFPMAFTSVCTEELCGVRDDMARYQDLDATVYGISVDSPFTLDRFRKDQNLPFALLSDFNKTASGAYGALYEDFVLGMKGVSKRAAFVVDAEGVVRYAEVLENAGEMPDLDAVKGALAELKSA
jgi:peroxiredoxin